MFKLKFSPPKYKMYQDGKTTVCSYDCVVYQTENKEEVVSFIISGRAVCSDSDTPDEKIGRMLAESRAKRNAYDYVVRHFIKNGFSEKEVNVAIKNIVGLMNFFKKTRHLKKNEAKHVRRIIQMT